jgi:hypothetical protein
LLVAEGLGLLLQEDGEGAFGQSACGFLSQLLQAGEVDVQGGALWAEGPPGHDFAPSRCQFPDVPEVVGLQWGTRHGLSCLVLGRSHWDAVFLPLYARQPFAAK